MTTSTKSISDSQLLTLPSELLEHVVVALAIIHPTSIAELSKTCQKLHSLIYNPDDSHLWREILLTTFDDPRAAIHQSELLRGVKNSFDWCKEFQNRIHIAGLSARRFCSKSGTHGWDVSQSTEIILRTLLSTIETTHPIAVGAGVSYHSESYSSTSSTSFIDYPTWPPLFIVLSQFDRGINGDGYTMHDLPNSHGYGTLNTSWLDEILRYGLSATLTSKLVDNPSVLGLSKTETLVVGQERDKLAEDQLLFKLISLTGFIPIKRPQLESTPETHVTGHTPDLISADTEVAHQDVSPFATGDVLLTTSLTPPNQSQDIEKQYASSRLKARRVVYNMRYLKSDRYWGPFMRPNSQGYTRPPESSSRGLLRTDDDDTGLGSPNNDDEEVREFDSLSVEVDTDTDSDVDESAVIDDVVFDLFGGHAGPSESAPKQLPAPENLIPDWNWIASARIVVENNLHELFQRSPTEEASNTEMLNRQLLLRLGKALKKTAGLRMGGAPGYWANASAETVVDGGRRGKKSSKGELDGWDWAGVEGVWR